MVTPAAVIAAGVAGRLGTGDWAPGGQRLDPRAGGVCAILITPLLTVEFKVAARAGAKTSEECRGKITPRVLTESLAAAGDETKRI
jgi:hypothetical protein